jgi:protein-disulfide isomerase
VLKLNRVRPREWALIAVLVVAAVALTSVLVARGGGGSDPAAAAPSAGPSTASAGAPAAQAEGPLGDLARRIPGDPLALGKVDAPVVMVMFSDFRCPFCAQFSRETEPQLVSRYVDNGTLRIEWRDFAIFGPESTRAAEAGRAAAAQGLFWEYNRAIYADSPERAHADLSDEKLFAYARQVGVPDMARFERDMNSPATAKAVAADVAEATSLGVPSTPAFVIDGNPILGAQPPAVFTGAIDRAAAP